jgi:hypothetical protein
LRTETELPICVQPPRTERHTERHQRELRSARHIGTPVLVVFDTQIAGLVLKSTGGDPSFCADRKQLPPTSTCHTDHREN